MRSCCPSSEAAGACHQLITATRCQFRRWWQLMLIPNRDEPVHSFGAHAANDDRKSISSSSTRQMLGGQHRNGSMSSALPFSSQVVACVCLDGC